MSKDKNSHTGPAQRVCQWYGENRYAILFCSLILTILFSPLQVLTGINKGAIHFFLSFNLIFATINVERESLRYPLLLAIAIAALLSFSGLFAQHSYGMTGGLLIWTIVALIAAARALLFSLKATKVSAEEICAALSTYLIFALFWGVLCYSLEQVAPGSFLLVGEVMDDFSLSRAIYYSFVTITTLGYGDIIPNTDAAYGLAAIEAVAGQLFLAVFVARLISAYTTRRS